MGLSRGRGWGEGGGGRGLANREACGLCVRVEVVAHALVEGFERGLGSVLPPRVDRHLDTAADEGGGCSVSTIRVREPLALRVGGG